jgi:hypothetical protein
VFSVAFSVDSEYADPYEVPPEQLFFGMLDRLRGLTLSEVREAAYYENDTYAYEPKQE